MIKKYWREFLKRYNRDATYWYVPKGNTVSEFERVKGQLKVLREFEGEHWRASQAGYIDRLSEEGISSAATMDDDSKGVPMARMIKQVLSTLGFAWIDEDEAVTLTPAGEALLASKKPEDIVAIQARRYQIANPMTGGKATDGIEIHPVPFLLEVLLETKTLTKTEYSLFVAKARSYGDIEDVIAAIQEWRKEGPRQHAEIVDEALATPIAGNTGNSRRSSIYNTINLNASYAMAFWAASGLIRMDREDGESTMSIPRGKLPEANAVVKRSRSDGQYIEFADKKDWMAFYGDPNKSSTREEALGYYTDTSRIDRVRQVLDEMAGYTEDEKRKYLSMMVSEETVEDILARNMELIEPGMELVQRQLITEVGRIDLFARDKKGAYTIIELKKGRTDDDVYGQLSRYMGWCKKTHARTSNVRGIIVAKSIGAKLWAAADGHSTPVELLEYDLKMSLQKAQRGHT